MFRFRNDDYGWKFCGRIFVSATSGAWIFGLDLSEAARSEAGLGALWHEVRTNGGDRLGDGGNLGFVQKDFCVRGGPDRRDDVAGVRMSLQNGPPQSRREASPKGILSTRRSDRSVRPPPNKAGTPNSRRLRQGYGYAVVVGRQCLNRSSFRRFRRAAIRAVSPANRAIHCRGSMKRRRARPRSGLADGAMGPPLGQKGYEGRLAQHRSWRRMRGRRLCGSLPMPWIAAHAANIPVP